MATLSDIVVGAVAAVVWTPLRGGPRLPEGFSQLNHGDEADDHHTDGSQPSPEAFGIATPPRDDGPAASEAGSAGSRRSSSEMMLKE